MNPNSGAYTDEPVILLYSGLLFAVGAVVMRGAGCVINDMWDRDIDAQVERTRSRPLASGTLSMRQAFKFLLVLLFAGLAIISQFPAPAIAYGVAACVLVVVYPLMKRITWWPQAFLGLTFNWGIFLGALALTAGDVWTIPPWAWAMYGAGILWTLGYDTIYAHQDKGDDARVGVKSTARRLGTMSRVWVGGFYIGVIALLGLSGFLAGMGWGFYPLLLIAGGHLSWQVRTWSMDDPENCLQRFRSNRDFGLIVLVAVVCGQVIR